MSQPPVVMHHVHCVSNQERCEGARLAFGGKPLEGHTIPKQYGAIEPTAVFVPLEEILKDGTFELVTTEVFGPVQASLCNLTSHSPLLSCTRIRIISHPRESLKLLSYTGR